MADGDELGRVRSWLNNATGFPVEYSAVRTLEAAGFEVDAGRFYSSPDTGSSREVDVVARVAGDELERRIVIVGECKHLPTPWVVLTRHRSADAIALLGWTIATAAARDALVGRARRSIASVGTVRSGIPAWFLATPEPHGSSLVAMPRSGGEHERESPHKALAQVVEAARGIVAETQLTPALAWPVLIVRGSLYQAELTPEGDLDPTPIKWQRIVWGGVTGNPVVVDVVTEGYLPTYARDARQGIASTAAAIRAWKDDA